MQYGENDSEERCREYVPMMEKTRRILGIEIKREEKTNNKSELG